MNLSKKLRNFWFHQFKEFKKIVIIFNIWYVPENLKQNEFEKKLQAVLNKIWT